MEEALRRFGAHGVRWMGGIALGALLVWLATLEWPLHLLFEQPVRLVGGTLVGGDLAGAALEAVAAGTVALPATAWKMHLFGLVPYMLALVGIHFVRAWRWAPLLNKLGHKVSFATLNSTGGISFAAIFLFPLRLGELVRPALLARETTVTMSEAMALVVLERIFDGLAVTLVLLGVLVMLPEGDPAAYGRIYTGTLIALLVFGAALAFIVGAYRFRRASERMMGLLIDPISPALAAKVREALHRFHRGLDCLPDARSMGIFAAVTLGYWFVNGLGHYAMVRAFGFQVDPVVGFAMMAAVAIGMMMPNAPANVGTFWYCLLLPLQIYGITGAEVQAGVFALTLWGLQMGQMTVFGLYFLARSPIRLRDVADAGVGAEADEAVTAG